MSRCYTAIVEFSRMTVISSWCLLSCFVIHALLSSVLAARRLSTSYGVARLHCSGSVVQLYAPCCHLVEFVLC